MVKFATGGLHVMPFTNNGLHENLRWFECL